MKIQLDIPEELHKLLSTTDLSSTRLAWTFQAGSDGAAMKISWKKIKTKAKTQKRTAEKRKPGGEITHPPPRVPVPVSKSSAVPDVPETTPAPDLKRTRRMTPSRYRRNQQRYWAWRNGKSRGVPDTPGIPMDTTPPPPTASLEPSNVVPDPPAPTKDPPPPSVNAVGDPPTSLLPGQRLFYCRTINAYILHHYCYRYSYSPTVPHLIIPVSSHLPVLRDPRYTEITHLDDHFHLHNYQTIIALYNQ